MSDDLVRRDQQHIWHPFAPVGSENIVIESASGVYLHTTDGRKIIDAVSSWWVNLHGHSHPDLVRALASQAGKLEHVIFAGFSHRPAIELSERLLAELPDDQARIFFSDDGSTAVEVGLKMAMQYWHNRDAHNRRTIVALDGAYHGDTFGAMSLAGAGLFTAPFASYLFPVETLPFPDDARVVERFRELAASGNVAAFIFEPLVQAASGMRVYPAEVLDSLIACAREHDIICIADEVFTGFGRTGKLFACDHLNNKPDIFCLSKGLTGGMMPLGVTTCNNRILGSFVGQPFEKTFFHGHSFTGNPMACAVSLESLRLLKTDHCQQAISRIHASHVQFQQKIQAHKLVKSVRVLGTIIALEVNSGDVTEYGNELRKKIYSFFLERNILLRPLGNIIYILPPYVISGDELRLIYQAIEEFLDALISG